MNDNTIHNIESDPESALMLQWTLQEQGFQVHVSNDFIDAAGFLKKNKPTLIVSDLMKNEKTTALDFYIHHVMKKSIPFALVSDTFAYLPSSTSFGRDALNPQFGTLCLQPYNLNLPCFEKPFDVGHILLHFQMLSAAL